ncbi:ATP-dependent DNA ligase [Variovorax sp. PCZ-1]|uniref:ATP-dependent DNA ligase n=1 Tax=Variovorax sp. PCZ-1 TaxID=2835533 RepID=UPI001BD132C0|nr:ATP-dependent DNA ligase [Variovorax sp. PCZ-1]MBS7806651.1 ATP-dependent DNA ligase [Variovorax sp. PCZ-1]
MKRFAQLYAELDATTSTNDKLAALQSYFGDVAASHPHDAAWALYFLAGGKPRQVVKTGLLKLWAQEAADIPEWLFEESYQAVGDLAETIAHIIPQSEQTQHDAGLSEWVMRLQSLKAQSEEAQGIQVKAWWREMDALSRFLLIKLIGGGFRVGVSKLLVTRALAAHAQLDAKIVAQRLMGYTDGKHLSGDAITLKFIALCAEDTPGNGSNHSNSGQPYPFFLAHGLPPTAAQDAASLLTELGDVRDWQTEWKYDGIRAQIVKRAGAVHVWSRGEELMNGRFPEIESIATQLPDGTVLDGEILVIKDGAPQPFNLLQQRIGRKTLTKKVLQDAPVGFMAYDLLEVQGQDIRSQAQHLRRSQLEAILAKQQAWLLSPIVEANDWQQLIEQRSHSRERGVEGLMLKKKDAAYGQGRTKADGLWWKWKIDPLTVDAVLIYAQAGHGRRASVYTDYTFAVWSRAPRDADEAQAVIDAIEKRLPAQPEALQLVAFAKAYSGLTDEEFKQIDAIIRKTTLEKFGPVRSVKPSIVFELGFEGINRSPRHKSGIAVRFPRMLRIRMDKPLHEANTLHDLQLLLNS